MNIGGNPEELRRLARQLRQQAIDVDDTASRVRRAEGVRWVGLAADRFRERLAQHGRDIEQTRRELVAAAASMDHLADVLEERQRAIARAMAFVEDELDSARRTVTSFAGRVWDTLTAGERAAERSARDLLDRVRQLPAPGDPGWLGLARQIGG